MILIYEFNKLIRVNLACVVFYSFECSSLAYYIDFNENIKKKIKWAKHTFLFFKKIDPAISIAHEVKLVKKESIMISPYIGKLYILIIYLVPKLLRWTNS
jgi:hypothetical protein